MPTFVTGDLWSELDKASVILVTTNFYLDKYCGLIMGAGAALQCKNRFPGIEHLLGAKIKDIKGVPYGVMATSLPRPVPGPTDNIFIGAFQVKYYYKDPARLELIEYSVSRLLPHASKFDRIALNFPGIGNGKLERAEVLPLLAPLPENVFIYELPPG